MGGNPVFGWAAATALAALTAWAGNRWVVPLLGWWGVVLFSPAVEEAAKTFWAVSLAGDLLPGGLAGGQAGDGRAAAAGVSAVAGVGILVVLVHFGFGLVEGVRDVVTAERSGGRDEDDGHAAVWMPVFTATLSHSVFGAVTAAAAALTATRAAQGQTVAGPSAAGSPATVWWPWLVGAAAAFTLHAAWNFLMVRARAAGGREQVGRG